MTGANYWRDALLYDLAGKQMGRVRVPKNPFPPGLILWGNRYFILSLPDGNYAEVKCFLVPLENMYAGRTSEGPMPFRKGEK